MMKTRDIQRWRSITQTGFFSLFIVAPPLDIFRYDLTQGHFIIFGYHWTLQLDTLQGSDSSAAINVLLLGLLPVFCAAIIFLFVAWRWGRLYCGWFCPHFSVVEMINKLMVRASGKPSIWERNRLPQLQSDRSIIQPQKKYWIVTVTAVLLFSFVWSLSLLTYLLPPFEIYHNLLSAELSRNQALFITVATTAFCIEFLLARHLFCRFGCAVGLFQSLAWMANRKAMVVNFDRSRASACKSCNNACDNACPMRLHPRTIKRKMFTCTECGECISACTQVQQFNHEHSLLDWVQGDEAKMISESPMSASYTRAESPGRGH